MDKFSELKAAADKYCAALNAHRENPTDKGALYAWDEAGSEFYCAINHKEMEIIIALLAELEAKDKRITTVTEESEFWRERVDGAEKEREEFRRRFNLERSCLEDADKRIAELEAKLARFGDVCQHYLAGYDDGHSRGLNAGRLYKEDTGMVMHRHASANAYAAEGDEQDGKA